jgi:uncharacterized protein
MTIQFELVALHNLPEHNVIVGQSHFIKTVEDVYEVMVNAVPKAQFGIAFCEASGKRLIRHSSTNTDLEKEAVRMAEAIGAGHSFVVVMKEMYPINVLNQIKMVPEVARIYCATANPVQVIVGVSPQGRGIVGVIDGEMPLGVEVESDMAERKELLRKLGYKQ